MIWRIGQICPYLIISFDSLFSIYFSNCFRILGLWLGFLSIYLACSLALGLGSWMLFHKLKNKTTVKKKRDCYINTKETAILTNKIKLLVLKLSFQKTMFLTNKNSLRQHNSKLSQNFDICRISLVSH